MLHQLIAARQLRKGAIFDGAADYQTRGADLTGNATGKKGIISLWFLLTGGDGAVRTLYDTGPGNNYVRISGANKFAIVAKDAAANNDLIMQSNTAYTAAVVWHHLLCSWDVASALGHLYIDDADDLAAGATLTNDTLIYTGANHAIGAETDGTDKFDGYLAEVYINFAEYIDITVLGNRRKFIDAAGRPANLGATGSLPTGTAPIIYFSVTRGQAATAFATNRGTGGNFTITGALAIAPTLPKL